MTDLYVYGIAAPSTQEFSADGLMRAPVSFLPVDGVSAIVSEGPSDDIMATRRNMLTHTKVLEQAMALGPVIPFRFGSVVAVDDLVDEMIRPRMDEITRLLSSLDGKYEMGIRVGLEEKPMMQRIVADDPSLKAAHDALAARGEAETRFERMELGRAVFAQLSARRDAIGHQLTEELSKICDDIRVQERSGDYEALNLACLVDPEIASALEHHLEVFDRQDPDLYTIKIVAPVPPYNFVDLRFDQSGERAA